MDITSDYGSLVRGSNPRGRAIRKKTVRLVESFAVFFLRGAMVFEGAEVRRGGSFVDLAFGEGIGAMTDEADFGDGAVERVQFFRR